jgi:PAS domain S-box-containing protein
LLPGLILTAQPEGHVDFVNQGFCDYTGQVLQASLGHGWQKAIHPEDLPFVLERWLHSVSTGGSFELEARIRRFDGEYHWFVLRARPLADATGKVVKQCALASDIDAQKRSEGALRGVRVAFRRMCESIPGLVCTLSPTGKVEFLNRALLAYFGKTEDELRGWAMTDAVHADDLPRVIAAHTVAVTTGSPYAVEHRCRRGDGVYRWFDVRALPVRNADGVITDWLVLLTDIEDRKHAEDAIRTSERNLDLIINTIPALAWSALPDGLAEFFNRHYLDYLGMTLDQAKGMGWTAAVHPNDLADLAVTWQRILASEKAGEAQARLRRADGEYRWFMFRASPLLDETGRIVKWYGTNTDIDDRKRVEDELRRKETFLAEGERLTLTGTFSVLLDNDEITFSEELYRIFEFERDTPLTLERIAARFHPDDVSVIIEKIALARHGVNDHQYECRLLVPSGVVKHLRINAYGNRESNDRLEYIGAMQDVTERRQSEEALGRVRSELAHMTRVASLGALTASIAHEVNQPLSGIITNANTCLRMLAAEPPNLEGARETARRTIRDGHRASDVITRLRAMFAKRDAANEHVDLNQAARELIALTRSELQRGRVALVTELADDLPLVVGDRVQLQQVVLNLLLNAAAAMSGIDDRPRLLTISTERESQGHVRLTVRDTGRGLDPGTIDRLFEPFYTTKSEGMGLGLSVSRSIIERHEGRLWATPNDGPGAVFSFSIPCAPERLSADAETLASGRGAAPSAERRS